mgnify:CR=1 FL=1|jgi:hypothetical protein
MKIKNALYIAYNKDGCPIYIEDSVQALAKKVGVTANNISKCICNGSEKYARIIDDGD